MEIIIDITNINLSSIESPIDTYDGKTIFFDIPNRLPDKLVFDVWGVSINKKADWKLYGVNAEILEEKFEKGTDIATIKGFGKFIMNDVVACKLKISPIMQSNKSFLIKEDKIISFERLWNFDKIDDDCFKYSFDTNIYFPNGNCELEIYAKGNAFFSFNSTDVMKYSDYLSEEEDNSFRGFLKDKSLGRSISFP